MSLTEVSLRSVTLKQYLYKLRSNIGSVYKLIMAQILALFFSLAGSNGMMSSGDGDFSVSVRSYSSSTVIVFSLLFILNAAIILTTKPYKRMENPFVGNKITGSLSDIGFLMTASVFAGFTSSLAGILLRVIMYFTFDRSTLIFQGFYLTISDLLLGIVVTILYMLLISALGYFIGMLAQVNMAIVILLPAVFLGTLRLKYCTDLYQDIYRYVTFDVSLILFTLYIISLSIVLFGASLVLSNRMEGIK